MKRIAVAALIVFGVVFTSPGAWAAHWEYTNGSTPLHWTDNDPSYPRGYVYWVDKTGAEWPIYSSAVAWDQAPRLDAIYTSSEAACPNTGHCVGVIEAPLGAAGCTGGQLGRTVLSFNNVTGHMHTSTRVEVDSGCSGAAAGKRRTIACHEMGHSIGPGEGSAGCMTSPYAGVRQLPSEHDMNGIAVVYNHND